jgi:hypothetical protein
MNLIRIQLNSIRKAMGFIGYSKPKRIDLLRSIVATSAATKIEEVRIQEDNRDVPQFEMEREQFIQEREQPLPDEYPFQDFNYGP